MSSTPTVDELSTGSQLGRWTLVERLGAGAFGTTWRAVGPGGAEVAVKLLDQPPGDELRALASVCHPAVVGVLGGGGAPPHLVMELARGRPLDALLDDRRPVDDDAVMRVLAHLADGLAAVHAAGVVHGDLKPANVVVGHDGRPRLVDFGMAGTRGGTRAYASPERSKTGPTPEADVYALGLVLWQLLHGQLPPAGSMGLRPTAELRPTRGEPWMRELLARMLSASPAPRPTASEIADTLAAHGLTLPEPGPELLRRRARTVFVRREHDARVDDWLEEGGALALLGSAGAGRTHALNRAAVELSARGRPWVMLRPGLHPWDPVRTALADPTLGAPRPLPAEPDPTQRAIATAADLEERADGLVVLVDDLDLLDDGSRATARALARRGRVSVLATAEEPVDGWTGDAVRVGPLDGDGVEALARGLLGGDASLGELVPTVIMCTGGMPGPSVEFLIEAVRDSSVLRRNHRWLVDDARLDELAASTLETLAAEEELGEDASAVGVVIGLAEGPVDLAALSELADLADARCRAALQELVSLGLAVAEPGGARAADIASAHGLAANATEASAVHGRLGAWLRTLDPVPWERVGWQIAGASDRDAAATDGARCIEAAITIDAGDAVRMAEALWQLAKPPALAVARVEALVAAGRADEGIAFGRAVCPRDPGADWVPLLARLAWYVASLTSDVESARGLLRKAGRAGGEDPMVDVARAQVHLAAGEQSQVELLCERTLREHPDHPMELRLRSAWARAARERGSPEIGLRVLDSATAPDQPDASWARLHADRGTMLAQTGRLHLAAHAYRRAIHPDLPATDRARIHSNVAACEYASGHVRQALTAWERAALLFERMESTRDSAGVCANLCLAYSEIGRWERAIEAGEEGLAHAAAPGLEAMRATILGNLGDAHFARGAPAEAEHAWSRAAEIADAAGLEGERVELARRRATLAAHRHDADAGELAREAIRLAEQHEMPFERGRAIALHALAVVRAGGPIDLETVAEEAATPLQAAGAARDLAEVRLLLAEALLEQGRPDQARERVERVITYADEVGAAPLRTRADALWARCGDPEDETPLDRLLDLAIAVARERDLPTLLGTIADAALGLLDAERAFVVLSDDHRTRVAAARTREGMELGAPAMSIVRRALSGRREVIAGDLDERGDLREAVSVMELELRSALCVPMIDGDEVLGAIYVDSRLATEQQWSEAARVMRALAAHAAIAVTNARHVALLEERAALAAEMAHDLSSPAHVVLCIADEILEDTLQPREIARDLEGTGRLLLGMRERFLGERAPMSQAPVVPLTERLERLSTQLARVARGDGKILALDVDESVMVRADAHELDRAVSNLVRNALRFSPPGGTVHLTQDVQGGRVHIRVRDQGPGIPAAKLETIFLRGVQAHDDGQGHGLGLAIAQRVVEAHGGRLSARNHPDGGAEFTVVLPVVDRTG